jgi:nucleoside 2-deoxyribosyltransferase
MISIYLAGGMRSKWQDAVMDAIDIDIAGARFYDPRTHGLKDEADYTVWDMAAIRRSDVVFAYLEADNPSGFGMSNEIAYAAALGKYVIFVDEKSPTLPRRELYNFLGINRNLSNFYTFNLADGIHMLRQVLRNPRLLDGLALTPVRRRILVSASQ